MVALTLGATAVISSVADNVAAYLFGKKVMEGIFEKAYGPDFKKDFLLKQYANNAPLLAAIIGGSATKVGNGANFLIKKVEAKLEGNEIKVEQRRIGLGESVVNPYSDVQVGAVIGVLFSQKLAIDKMRS